jgi:DNA-3-methyladenine glycosylase II
MPVISLTSKEVTFLAERDYRLHHLMKYIGDLEYSRPESAFHSLAHSIIEQMLSMKAGRAIESRLQELCDGDYTPERIADITAENIKSCGMSFRKAQSLKTLAEYALANDLEALAELPDDQVYKTLVQLPGIGKWTCDMFMLFYLGRPDILPVEDGALRQAFEWLYGAPIVSKEVQAVVCSLWRPYSSTAVRYLYRALNTGLVKEFAQPEMLWS